MYSTVRFVSVGRIADANGQGQRVAMYDRQVYLSHHQARVLYDALGRCQASETFMAEGGVNS